MGDGPVEGVGPRRVGPEGVGPEGCKISRFFSLSRPIFALFVSLWVSSRGILVVFEAQGARLEFSGCRVKSPGGPFAKIGLAKVSHNRFFF